jgi:hypothetical protein
MQRFIIFIRRPWYRQKRFVIPIGVLIVMLIVAAIVSIVLGLRAAAIKPSKIFTIFGSRNASDSLKEKHTLTLKYVTEG